MCPLLCYTALILLEHIHISIRFSFFFCFFQSLFFFCYPIMIIWKTIQLIFHKSNCLNTRKAAYLLLWTANRTVWMHKMVCTFFATKSGACLLFMQQNQVHVCCSCNKIRCTFAVHATKSGFLARSILDVEAGEINSSNLLLKCTISSCWSETFTLRWSANSLCWRRFSFNWPRSDSNCWMVNCRESIYNIINPDYLRQVNLRFANQYCQSMKNAYLILSLLVLATLYFACRYQN